MKLLLIPITTLVALAASSSLHAQTAAYSKPSGYVTQPIVQGFNMLGVNLVQPSVATGSFSGVSATQASDSANDFSLVLTAGASYILEIISGTQAGAITEVTSWSVGNLNTSDDLVAAGVQANDQYTLRKAPTLEEVFGTTNSALTKNNSVLNADVVWVANGASNYIRYFQNNTGAWRNATTPGLAPNTPLVYLDGIFIQRKLATPIEIVFTGEVQTRSVQTTVGQGFNLLSTVYPAGSTLQNIGLDTVLAKNNSVLNADVVWLANGAGGYTRYFLNNTGAWRNATVPALVTEPVPITSGILIQKKTVGSTPLLLTPPASYANL